MTSFSWPAARTLLFALALTSVACGKDPAPVVPDAQAPRDDYDAGKRECQTEGSTRACTCSSGTTGRKTCSDGVYGSCENCIVPRGDAGRSTGATSTTLCKAGYYTGQIEGSYRPGFASLGLTQSGFEVQFQGEALDGRPALSLTLQENSTGPVGEFSSFTVNGGCIQGVARSGSTNNPFVAKLSGDLDCNTGAFVGVMEGEYTLVNVEGFDFHMKGPITAQFEPSPPKLSDGKWTLEEPPALDGKPAGGGTGTWNATWVADAPPDAGSVDPCANIVSTGPLDAGVGTDAGR